MTPGTTIKVTVGTGLETVQVPDGLVGKSLEEATAILTGAKLQVVSQEADATEPLNQVTQQDPAAGQRVQEGEVVTLTVSNNSLMVMPNLRNNTPGDAAAILQERGWAGDASTLSQSTQPVTNLALVGAILNQTPAADSVVPKIGTAVRITVGIPGQVDIPNVVGKPEAEARALMAGVPGVSWATVGGTPAGAAGTVQGQTAAGLVNIGTAVTVNVYGPEAAPPPPASPPASAAPPASSAPPGG